MDCDVRLLHGRTLSVLQERGPFFVPVRAGHAHQGHVHTPPRDHYPHHPGRKRPCTEGVRQSHESHSARLPCRSGNPLFPPDRQVLYLQHVGWSSRVGRMDNQCILFRRPGELGGRGNGTRREERPGEVGQGQCLGTRSRGSEAEGWYIQILPLFQCRCRETQGNRGGGGRQSHRAVCGFRCADYKRCSGGAARPAD